MTSIGRTDRSNGSGLIEMKTGSRWSGLLMFALLGGLIPSTLNLALLEPRSAAAAQTSQVKTIVATAVRRRGFPCRMPDRAERQTTQVKAHQAVWILHCSDAAYRVKFVLDTMTLIERLPADRSNP